MNGGGAEHENNGGKPGLRRFVPPVLISFWERAFMPASGRVIVDSKAPLRAYIHPHTHLGRNLLQTGRYEVETEEIIRREVHAGDVFLDIGANEGFLSAFAGTLVGPQGLVIAIEPQSRLQAIIEINLRLNDVRRFRIFHRAIGESSSSTASINLYPEINTGQSSLLKKPRFGWTTVRRATEEIRFIAPQEILAQCGVDRFDMIKVDVEGFEYKVVDALLPIVREGKVRKLLLDYHASILAKFGIDAADIHRKLLDAGMRVVEGDTSRLESYLLYYHSSIGADR
ncbi:MAG: FkbM family methyltransferase [Phycisphaeraceae bacterium]|nr:FkbM family methyltransferase [Phycisphaeraceae bacterium]